MNSIAATRHQVIGLFPTPLLRVQQLLPRELAAALAQQVLAAPRDDNVRTDRLSHSAPVAPDAGEAWQELARRVLPEVADFGELLLGQALPWHVTAMWANVLEPGGAQSLHNHANSFVSGVVYLSEVHPSASLAFVRGLGNPEFVMRNHHAGSASGPFNADKWALSEVAPGDAVLFPSWLLHEVPRNEGARRLSVAFNAVPERLDSWGYRLGFAP